MINAKMFPAVLLLCVVFSHASSQVTKPSFDGLGWIAGCWKNESPASTVEEQWMKASGNSMIGMSRTVRNGRTVAYEFLRIVQQGDSILYISIPSGQRETAFRLITCTENEAIFENPTHDFPQRIIYHLAEDGSLLVSIEGNDGEKHRRVEFPMKRVRCDE